jgi:transcriptional regulator with XRE-family HTH domain
MLPNEMQAIAKRLDALAVNVELRMRANGMTEDALAHASGVSKRTVGNFLRPGNRASKRGTSKSFPSGTIANLLRIAAALDVEAWELLCVSGPSHQFHAAVEAAYLARRRSGER